MNFSVEHTLSLYSTADVCSSSSRSILSASFFEGLLRHSVLLTPKTVGTALVEVFTATLPVEATTPLVSAPPDIRREHGVCNA